MTAYKDWSDAQKRAHKKYDQKNYSVVGCKLPRDVADAFRAYCVEHGKSVSSVLAEYVRDALREAGQFPTDPDDAQE